MDAPATTIAAALEQVGPRLRRARTERGVSLGALAEATGISKSTLSRLETGQRRPSLELLLPLAQAFGIPLDDLVGAPEVGDPRIRLVARQVNGRTVIPLTRQPGGLRAWKIVAPPATGPGRPEQRSHDGYAWLYVLAGRMRLLLADRDLVLGAGEVAEFDAQVPHWFGSADAHPVELLSLLGQQGERIHVRARTRRR